MLDYQRILQLYENVLHSDIERNNVNLEAIKLAIESMAVVYGEVTGLKSERSVIADYTDIAHRCAYLHKYAALHTSMVQDMFSAAIRQNFEYFYKLVFSGDRFRLCSLGGGPGNDVIGVLAALHGAFSYFDTSSTVIDYMHHWSYSFDSILRELGTGYYGAFGNNISSFLHWKYIGANLLKTFQDDVVESLSTANLVTMIKFASAAACLDTSTMIKKIFSAMLPGAVLLFIDNDGGGFHNLMMDAAYEFGFYSIFGPHRRENYMNKFLKVKRFGFFSCFKTTVTVHILQKPAPLSPYHNFANAYGTPNLVSDFTADTYPPLTKEVPFFADKYSVQLSPPTPFLYREEQGIIDNERRILLPNPPLSTPIVHVNSPLPISSPGATPSGNGKKRRRGKKGKGGCLPIRMRTFHNQISKRISQIKARFFKKGSKQHPIYRM